MRVIGAPGNTVKEILTVPLRVEDDLNGSFKHSFMLSSGFPEILLGRDLMCVLDIRLGCK